MATKFRWLDFRCSRCRRSVMLPHVWDAFQGASLHCLDCNGTLRLKVRRRLPRRSRRTA
jgi:DNA-directed RNA polymerase subunit RPC12/RpoP